MSSTKDDEVFEAVGLLCAILRGGLECKLACVEAGAVPILVGILNETTSGELDCVVEALSLISTGDVVCKMACMDADVIPALVEYMRREYY